jgi:hypothetical protein
MTIETTTLIHAKASTEAIHEEITIEEITTDKIVTETTVT